MNKTLTRDQIIRDYGMHESVSRVAWGSKIVTVLDEGYVQLVNSMGDDAFIAEAARQSVSGGGVKTRSDDRALLRHLLRKRHTSPFEMVELVFKCRMPIFVARQWIRHRTASVNEQSGSYGEMPELFYVPEPHHVQFQSKNNKQGRGQSPSPELASAVVSILRGDAEASFDMYRELLGKPNGDSLLLKQLADEIREGGGISRELARINLPLTTYTQWYWKSDLHNLLHFLELRLDAAAQWEIRQYAQVMALMVMGVCPLAWEAFEDYRLESATLSGPEVEVVKCLASGTLSEASSILAEMSEGEKSDFRIVLARLGLYDRLGASALFEEKL